ncbi:hypothetical protein CYMTET_5151 [Cymbomonas tetramitiformis]|uniref:DNA topoisomerase 2 n=1 Tax=Cymbomonas tetramitiformis TaxID=36881 RepID=A0AAE0H005_9CHLO|nr:hypothetical protein CYMTET_5151 [Cymbomonas tetramitiformis]
MATVRVDIDQENNSISVYNDGAGVPEEIHSEEKVYIPEMIFGHLLTSSNYDDTKKRVTGGRNGYGAKLANIFSTEFTVETCDGSRQKRYHQRFTENMNKIHKPRITACKASDNWTKVTFKPDLAKFGMTRLEDDIVSILRKRVYDMAAVLGKGCKVYLNGKMVPVRTFKDYVNLYLKDKTEAPVIYEQVNDRWEICVSVSEGQFQQVSFVNGICTSRGGTHVNYIADQVASKLVAMIIKKNKNCGVKPLHVKNHLMVFVNALIENPTFDSQTKETLTVRAASFGSKCEISEDFMKKVHKSSISEHVLSYASFKQSKELKKNDGAKRCRLTGIPKLDDADDAGGKHSQDCTLILTEGDSAKALAISGLSVVGRDRYGVFPLRGKLLNVRDAKHEQIMNNAEITHIKQILGLQHGKKYEDTKSLRYGHLMIMTDQDHDGSHIKGLLINFIHHFFPELLKIQGFLVEFITPIVKVTKGKQSHAFYTLPEYEAWIESIGGSTKGWSVKYYKGLGTSTAAEAKSYFAQLAFHKKGFLWATDGDGDLIEMAFAKKKVEERKTWLRNFQPGTFLDQTAEEINYGDFINKELILFSLADLQRSIPALIDGFKPGQRKILFAAFKRKLKNDIKVAQLSGYVSEHAAYHHGETSLASTIVNLAQSFVGSNNVNLLYPSGQFGTRLMGGKDHASARYIFTRLTHMTRLIFSESDDALLAYQTDDGLPVEPEVYVPTIPMVLVNGADGIGTGWSTFIPNYNPRDIVANLQRMINDEEVVPMMPWYKGFTGSITRNGESFTITGTITQVDDTTLEITELPIRKWTTDYKEFLEGMLKPEKKDEVPFITDYKEYHTDLDVRFVVSLSAENMQLALKEGLNKKFKLSTTMGTTNMMLFNKDGKITKYPQPEDIMREFFDVRIDFYERRKKFLLYVAEQEMLRLSNKVRFILGVVNGEIKVSNRKKKLIEVDLERMGFDKLLKSGIPGVKMAASGAGAEDDGNENSEESAEGAAPAAAPGMSYEYLLSMPIYSLTLEKVEQLCTERDGKQVEVDSLKATTCKDLWLTDLDCFLEGLTQMEETEAAEALKLTKQQAQACNGKNRARGAGKKKATSDSDMSEDDDDFVPSKKKAAPKPRAAAKPAATKPSPVAQMPAPQSSGDSASMFTSDTAMTSPADAPAAAAAKLAAKGRGTKKAPAKAPEPAQEVESEEESVPLSLMERLALKQKSGEWSKESKASKDDDEEEDVMSPPPKKAPAKKAAPRGKAAAKVVASADDDDEAAPVKPAPKGRGRKAAVIIDSDEEEVPKPAAVKPAAKPAAKNARGAKAKTAVIDDSEDDDDVPNHESMQVSPAPKSGGQEAVYDFDEASPVPKAVQKRPLAKKPAALKVVNIDDSASEGPTPQPKKTKRALPSPANSPAAVRPARAGRANVKKSYVEISDSEGDAEEGGSESEQSAWDGSDEDGEE